MQITAAASGGGCKHDRDQGKLLARRAGRVGETVSWSREDIGFMQLALDEARTAEEAGEVPVGAVVVVNGNVVGCGHNRSIRDHDPTAHAEIVALRQAAAASRNYRLPAAVLYVTLEPCAMCIGAIAEARIARVVFGAYDPKAGAAGSCCDLTDTLQHRFEVNGGVLEDECGEILKRFFAERR